MTARAEASAPEGGDQAPALRARTGPLFELDGVDRLGIVIDRTGLEAYIPHRGLMMLIDGVVWHNDDYSRGVAVKHVRADEFWCAGHIPGRPLMPGVLMVEAGAQLASFLYYARVDHRKFAGFTRIENTVFRGTVTPGDDLLLLADLVRFQPRRFIYDLQGMVGDRIVFESRATGMIF